MKKVYFFTTASKLLVKCLECMGVDYDVNRNPFDFNDYVASAIVTDIQIDFIFDLITNHDPLVSCYDQEEYDEYVREESC
jgi:hypothetical protein